MFDFDNLDDDVPDPHPASADPTDVADDGNVAGRGFDPCDVPPAPKSASGVSSALVAHLANAMSDVLCLGEDGIWEAFGISMRSDGYAMLHEVLNSRDARSHVLKLAPDVVEADLAGEISEVPSAAVEVIREMAATLRCEDGHFRFELYNPAADDLGGWIRPTLSELHEHSLAKSSVPMHENNSLGIDRAAADALNVPFSHHEPSCKASSDRPSNKESGCAASDDCDSIPILENNALGIDGAATGGRGARSSLHEPSACKLSVEESFNQESEVHEKSLAKDSSPIREHSPFSVEGTSSGGLNIRASPHTPSTCKVPVEEPLKKESDCAPSSDKSCPTPPRSPWYVPRPFEGEAQEVPVAGVKQTRREGLANAARSAGRMAEPGPSPLLRRCMGSSSSESGSAAGSRSVPGVRQHNVPSRGVPYPFETRGAGTPQPPCDDDLEPPGPPPGAPPADREMPPGPPPGSPPKTCEPPPGPPPGSPPKPSEYRTTPASAPAPPPAPRRKPPPPKAQPTASQADSAAAAPPVTAASAVAPVPAENPVTVAAPPPQPPESFRWADAASDEEQGVLAVVRPPDVLAGLEASPDAANPSAPAPAEDVPSVGADAALDAATGSAHILSRMPAAANGPATEVPAAVQLPNGRFCGYLHEYFPDRSFGFTSVFGLPVEVFVHGRSFFFKPPRDLGPGAQIEFDLDCRHGKPRALNVLLVDTDLSETLSVASRDAVTPHLGAVTPPRDAVAPPRDAGAPPRAVAPPRDAVAPSRDAVAPHRDAAHRRCGTATPSDIGPKPSDGTRARGRLRSFKPEGYGFVACEGLGDVHVSARAFAGAMPGKGTYGDDGPEVSFDLVQDECTGRMRACNAQLVCEPELPVARVALEVAAVDIPTEVLAEELLKRLSSSEPTIREYFANVVHQILHRPGAVA